MKSYRELQTQMSLERLKHKEQEIKIHRETSVKMREL